MSKLAGFEIETLTGTIECCAVFIDIEIPINRAFFVHRDIKRIIMNDEGNGLDGANPKLLVGEIGNNYLVVS